MTVRLKTSRRPLRKRTLSPRSRTCRVAGTLCLPRHVSFRCRGPRKAALRLCGSHVGSAPVGHTIQPRRRARAVAASVCLASLTCGVRNLFPPRRIPWRRWTDLLIQKYFLKTDPGRWEALSRSALVRCFRLDGLRHHCHYDRHYSCDYYYLHISITVITMTTTIIITITIVTLQ